MPIPVRPHTPAGTDHRAGPHMQAKSPAHCVPHRTMSSGIDTLVRHRGSVAMHPSADGPGEHQKGPLEISLGHPFAPHPRPNHQHEGTHPPDEGSGKGRPAGSPPNNELDNR